MADSAERTCEPCGGEGTVFISRDRRDGERTCTECEGFGEIRD